MKLGDAIAQVESASTQLANADNVQTAAQKKYDDALSAKANADAADDDAVAAFNSSLDELIEAAQASKVERVAVQIPAGPAAGGGLQGGAAQ